MRGEAERQQRVLAPLVAQREALGEVVVRIGAVGRRKIEHDHAERYAHAGFQRGLQRRAREEVHVVEAGDAAAQHLGAGEQRAVLHELRRDVLHLGGPDVLLQPAHQRQVVGQAAHQRHRRVGVRVHQPRDQRMLAEVDLFIGGIARLRVGARQHGLDQTVAQRDAMLFQDRARGLDRDDPARTKQAAWRDGLRHGIAVNSNRAA
jgi:hypothetical protein